MEGLVLANCRAGVYAGRVRTKTHFKNGVIQGTIAAAIYTVSKNWDLAATYLTGDYYLCYQLLMSAGIGGSVASFVIVFFRIYRPEDAAPQSNETFLTGVSTGIAERIVFTMLVASADQGGAAACSAAMFIWITIKAQIHYSLFGKSGPRAGVWVKYRALLASLASVGIAAWVGTWKP